MFSETLEDVLHALQAGEEPRRPALGSAQDVMAWLALLTEAHAADALENAVRDLRRDGLWSVDCSLQSALGLVICGRSAAAGMLLRDPAVGAPDADACFELASSIGAAGHLDLTLAWLGALGLVWPSDVRLNLMRGGVAQARGQHKDAIAAFAGLVCQDDSQDLAWDALRQSLADADLVTALDTLISLVSVSGKRGAHFVQRLRQQLVPFGLWAAGRQLTHLSNLESDRVLNAERRAWVQLECLRWNDALVTINSADINDRDKAFFRFAVHWALHDYAAAAAEAEQLLVVDPSDADAHHNLAFAYLMQGKWAAGWEEWEWRFKLPAERRGFLGVHSQRDLPLWDGKPTPETVVLCAEQGLGDVVQMLRYLPAVLPLVGGMQFSLPSNLMSLFEGMDQEVASETAATESAAEPTLRLPLMSLPLLLGKPTPEGKPYLSVDPARRARAADWLSPKGLRVGLVWAGSREFPHDYVRSPHLLNLLPLFDVPGVTWHVLQKGAAISQVACMPVEADVVRIDEQINDMADLAAVVSQLDLVISMCSMPAHIAGALGVPVWVMLSTQSDYRWCESGDRTAWYDSMRLFRQRNLGDWSTVVADMQHALKSWVECGAMPEGCLDSGGEHIPLPVRRRAGVGYAPPSALWSVEEYTALLAKDDRHVGSMLGLARAALHADDPLRALMYANQACRYGLRCTYAWRLLHDAMVALGMPEADEVARRVQQLTDEQAPNDWFGWQ